MEQIFIKQREEENDLYRQLGKQSLKRLQGLSRDLWTDYNEHDPGVTMTDLLNYALTELDYRLRFDMSDYLVAEAPFSPGRYGLFSPSEVFPVRPVTSIDYRKLIVDAVDEIENLWIYPAPDKEERSGWYEILVELTPGGVIQESKEKVRKRVAELYNQNRNLGEGLCRVLFVERRPLMLEGDIEVEPDVEVASLLAGIYWEAVQFFIPGIRYRRMEELLAEGKTLDELLDGPELRHWVMEDVSLKPLLCTYSVPRLYRRLLALKGVKNVRFLNFREEGQIFDNLIETESAGRSYTVLIPEIPEDTGLRLLVGNTPMTLDFSHLSEMLYAKHAQCYGYQNRTVDLEPFMTYPKAVSRDIYKHNSVQNDFPECYAIGSMGVASGDTEARKAQARQLKAYLLLFDEVFGRGLKELEFIPRLVDVGGGLVDEGVVPLDEPEMQWRLLVESVPSDEGDNDRFLRERKRWADMLDRIYGEDSYPLWLNISNFYDSTEAEITEQRYRFLQRIPEWGRDRALGVDLLRNIPANVPGIKAYVSVLLGFEIAEERPVVNVFPFYNLKLVDDEKFRAFQGHVLSHDLISEEVLCEENMEQIPLTEKLFADMDYHVLRHRLPILHYNLLFEGLFRGGIRLENYRLLNLPMHPDRLLMFYHYQKKEWINLGRFTSREELIDTANSLRRFLVMLNRKSETLYVVEHLHLSMDDGYAITVVLPGWSVRMADASFRETCEMLICMRLPAHLNVHFRWLPLREMWLFEQAYYDWRKALASGETGGETVEKLRNIIR